jgi:cell division protein FtsL
MTPTATGHRSRTLGRTASPRAPRRLSGPTRPPRAALAGAGAGSAVARPPFSLRLGRRAMRVGDARVLDRLVRGRAWIAIVAVALIGIVFMQVSMLKLNAGVSRAVTAADTLERQNSTLRADISQLDSGERVQDAAAKLGMVARAAGDVHYLDAARASAARAAASIKPPNPLAPTLGAAATGAAATGTTGTPTGAANNGTSATAATTGAAATGAATTPGVAQSATPTGAAGTGTATTAGATQSGAASQTGAATQNGASQTGAAAPSGTAAQSGTGSTPTGAASPQQTAPPATGNGTVAGGATATPGEG